MLLRGVDWANSARSRDAPLTEGTHQNERARLLERRLGLGDGEAGVRTMSVVFSRRARGSPICKRDHDGQSLE